MGGRLGYNATRVTPILRRPSIAVACWAALLIGLFAWRGDLGLTAGGARAKAQRVASVDAGAEQGPVVVRRSVETQLPRATRRGVVFDTMGFSLVGAEVRLSERAPLRTDADGAFAVDLLQHRATDLLVRAEERRPQWLRASAVGPDPLFVRLEPSAPWDTEAARPTPAPVLRGEGEVFGPDGAPLRGAFVAVLGTDCWGRTDDIGRVELPLPSPNATFVVHAAGTDGNAGGFAARSEPFVAPRARGVVPLPRLVASSAGSIRGVVRDASGQPVSGVPVEVRGAGEVRRVATGAGGAFVLSGLLPDEYVVEPFAFRGEVGVATDVRVDRAVVACDLQLRPSVEASLRVVDERGEVAVGVWVASHIDGIRRGLGRADDFGRVQLPVGSTTSFEVRAADGYSACKVESFDATAEPATLVISQP